MSSNHTNHHSNPINDVAKILEENWQEVKSEMRRTWRHLTEDDVNSIKNYKDLIKQLKKRYELSEDEVEEKINKFIDKLDLQPNLNRLEQFKAAFNAGAGEAKVTGVIKSSADVIHEKAEDWTGTVSDYVKDNPLKALGLGVLVTIAIKHLLINKSEPRE